MAITSVARDPFARGEYRRESAPGHAAHPCDWCGQRKPTMYRYAWQWDDCRTYIWGGWMCNLSCHRAFHGE